MSAPIITRGDKASPVWFKLMERQKLRLEHLRSQLEDPYQPDATTALLRGRIAEVRAILALDKDTPQEKAADKLPL